MHDGCELLRGSNVDPGKYGLHVCAAMSCFDTIGLNHGALRCFGTGS